MFELSTIFKVTLERASSDVVRPGVFPFHWDVVYKCSALAVF